MNKSVIGTYLPELLLLLLAIVVGTCLIRFAELEPVVADSIGYVVAGQNLGSGQGFEFVDSHNVSAGPFFYPHAFRMLESGAAGARFGYPPGFPLLIAVAVFLSGRLSAAYFVVPILGILAILFTYWLGWLLSENKWVGVGAAWLLATTALFWQFSSAAWSEVPSLVCLVSGVACYVYSRKQMQLGKTAIITSVVAGSLIGFSFFIRYTNLILVMPTLLLYELYTARLNILTEKRRWVFFIVAGFLAVAVLLFNWINLGGPFNSIYSTPALGAYPWPYFSLDYAFGPSPVNGFSFKEAMLTLWANFYFLLLLVPVWWIWVKKPQFLLATGICLTTLFLYSIYAFAPTDINARFLLPMFPFLSLLIVVTAVQLIQTHPPSRWYKLLLAATVLWLAASTSVQVNQLQTRNQANAATVAQVQQLTRQVPANAVWLSSAFNDLVIVYGRQSALNYRRMILVNPDTEKFDMGRYEACLVQTVDKLLAVGTPVFFLQDRGWNTAEYIQNHFALTTVSFHNNVVQIVDQRDETSRDALIPCR